MMPGSLGTAVCLLFGAGNLHAQVRPPEADQGVSDLQQVRQRMMDRRHQVPEQDDSKEEPRSNRLDSAKEPPPRADRFNEPPGASSFGAPPRPGQPSPQYGERGAGGFGLPRSNNQPGPGRPYAFRAQPGGPGLPPPPMRRGWGRLGGFGPRAGEMDRGPDGRGRFQEGARARGWQGQPQDD